MMKDLLVMCYPTWGPGENLHLDSKGRSLVLAPDYFLCCLRELGVSFDLVSLTEDRVDFPAFQSGIAPMHHSSIDFSNYRIFWHMFRDPTQPEVLAKLEAIGFAPGERLVINHAERLTDMFKDVYLPVLARHGLGAGILNDAPARTIEWERREHSVLVSTDGRYVRPFPYNNNRGDYRERNGREVVSEYIDNLGEGGARSIFRVGFALRRCVPGYRYFGKNWIMKSGSASSNEPYEIPERFHTVVADAMSEIGVDVCHLEGLEKDGRIYLFDINPYPTAHGSTLSTITRGAARVIAESLQ